MELDTEQECKAIDASFYTALKKEKDKFEQETIDLNPESLVTYLKAKN
jgi:hypothetical protein